MKAALLKSPKTPLEIADIPVPSPSAHQVLIKVSCCGLCRTDLHIVDGELTKPKLPLVPGHQIVGVIVEKGKRVRKFRKGTRVGVPWLGSTCGVCAYCRSGRENLCELPTFTGYTIDGGFAEYAVADWRYCFLLPDGFADMAAAPLLCAGLIGYRALRFAKDARHLGLYGFGAAAHIIAQVAKYQERVVYAFTKEGDGAGQAFARSLGADWAGASGEVPPHLLDAAIIFAPAGNLVPLSLRSLAAGGVVVCAGIHMSDIPQFSYDLLWGERSIVSVANLTRADGEEFLPLAAKIPVKTNVSIYPISKINDALSDLRLGRLNGSAVVVME